MSENPGKHCHSINARLKYIISTAATFLKTQWAASGKGRGYTCKCPFDVNCRHPVREMQGELFRLFVPAQAQQFHLEFHHLICAPLASELPLLLAGSQRAKVSSRSRWVRSV